MNGTIAFFDFDGTVTSRDTFFEFIKFTRGKSAFYAGFLLYAPEMLLFKLSLISNHTAKEIMMRHFFRRMTLDEFNDQCRQFSEKILPGLIRQKALTEIKKLQDTNAEIVVVSASPENWIRHWCEERNIQCVASRLVVDQNKITGKLVGRNCYGEEKVSRIRELFDLSRYRSVYCYGDTPGDRPMLALGTVRFYKPFR